jgi:hypothetical protein
MTSFRQVRRSLFCAAAVAVAAIAVPGCGSMSSSNVVTWATSLSGANEVPPVDTGATGTLEVKLNKDTGGLSWTLSYTGLSGPATAAHFHGPAVLGQNAGVVVPFPGPINSGMQGMATITPAQMADLLAGKWYANVHSAAHPGGEIRGQLSPRM